MRYENVCVEGFFCTLPDEVVSSEAIEARLSPLYQRLRLPEGRLELMTGIARRRFWESAALPGQKSVLTGRKAIEASGIAPAKIGALVHGSVCRDYLEPATACAVHQELGLPPECQIYDVSNACLGLLNGMIQVANLIELGQISAGLVVGTESGRGLVEATIDRLNRDTSFTRNDIKAAFASLTIGSASAAIVLASRQLSRTGNRLLGGIARANTQFCHLCRSGRDETVASATGPLMWTDAETLMREGIQTAKDAFSCFLTELGWTKTDLQKTFCHQVGRTHQKLLFDALGLDPAIDYTTLSELGNTGSTALPTAASLGIAAGHVAPGDHVALLGIGSGINVIMLGLDWQSGVEAR